MKAARIAELLEPFLGSANDQRLTTDDLRNISIYIDLLLRWNARINLTAVRDPEQIVTRHFGESLFAARHLFPRDIRVGTAALRRPAERSSAAASTTQYSDHRGRAALQGRVKDQKREGALAPVVTLADLGSGAGFPGIPIKLWAPYVSLTLIESNHKKATFLREVIRALTLTDVNILNARAEALTEAAFDVVTLRAVERFQSVLPVAGRFLAPEGRLALLIGSAQFGAARSSLPGLDWTEPEPIPLSRSRILAIAQLADAAN